MKSFGPPDLETINQAYHLACDRLASSPFRDVVEYLEREKTLRESVFFVARDGDDAQSLCDRVLTMVPESWISGPPPQFPKRRAS